MLCGLRKRLRCERHEKDNIGEIGGVKVRMLG